MSDKGNHLKEDQIFAHLSTPDQSEPTTREGSPVPHLRDKNGNDPSDRLAGLGEGERVEVNGAGEVQADENDDRDENGEPRDKVGDVRSTDVSSSQPHEVEEATTGNEEEGKADMRKDEVNEKGDGHPNQSKSAMRGGRDHRPSMNVHWRSSLRAKNVNNDEESRRFTPGAKRTARRLVRQHTGRPAVPPPNSDDEDITASGSAVSLESTNTRQAKPVDRRRSSNGYSTQSSDDDIPVRKGRGVLSELLSLYQRDRNEKDRGVVKSLLSSGDEIRRRRWSDKTLYDVESRRGSVNSVASGASSDGGDSDASGPKKRVRRSRRHQQLPHRSQNLDDPYIPAPKTSHPISPSTNVTFLQRAYEFLSQHGGPATWLGSPSATNQPRRGGVGDYRNIVALVITTSSLAGPATPALSHLAPAAGQGAETSNGGRKLSYYENANATVDRRRADEERDEELFGEGGAGTSNFGKIMEEGRVKQTKLKNGRNRGKRKQKEMAVTKHIASIVQRKLLVYFFRRSVARLITRFIEMLAKSVVNFGAPAHAVESWLSSTADILQVDASFIYLPNVLIVAFRDSDVHSTDILFIRAQGGLELYRLSLLHQVYRKVVRDEISASQGCRVLRRIERQTIPYPVWVLILVAAVASATASRVAFAGSFVDILMSGVLGSILATVQFTIAGRHRLLSNIFEIGMAGILAFFARGLGSTGYFCYQSVVSASIVLILPGWHICLGALELGSKNILAGGIRIVWAIVYTLFLSFGLSIGSQIWDSFGPEQPGLDSMDTADGSQTVTVSGSFFGNDTTWNSALSNGTFTFTNGSSTSAVTQVACYRNPEYDMWWYNGISDWWLFLLVPIFAASLGIWFRADWRSRDMIVMVFVGCAGYAVSFFLDTQMDQPNVTSAVAAFTVGVLGNLYSRLGGGSAFPSMVSGILLQVPNAIAAAGGLSADSDTDNPQGINTAVLVSIRMIQVGIGLAIGLFAAALVVYPFGKRGRYIFSY